jgi:beta-aspartyl-peptidase (threonine type)
MFRPAIVIHGGAGRLWPDREAERGSGCRAALDTGWRVLSAGGSALDAVCEAVVALENWPIFNAGRGSALTVAGTIEMDASVMEGTQLRTGAAAVISNVRNPVRLARAILDEGKAIFLVGSGAEELARAKDLEMCSPEELVTPHQLEHWQKRQSSGDGTVGAVAVDAAGSVAAATSTGGIEGKPLSRIGDSAVIGAGTYADDALGAVSATGVGEAIIRAVWARDTAELLRGGSDPSVIAAIAVERLERATGGKGGVIIVDPYGRIGHAHNTPAMTWAWMRADRADFEIHA